MGKITIRDVAREAGVSISLVSLVMNAKRDAEGNLDCNVNKDTALSLIHICGGSASPRPTSTTRCWRLRNGCARTPSG